MDDLRGIPDKKLIPCKWDDVNKEWEPLRFYYFINKIVKDRNKLKGQWVKRPWKE